MSSSLVFIHGRQIFAQYSEVAKTSKRILPGGTGKWRDVEKEFLQFYRKHDESSGMTKTFAKAP